MGNDRFKIEEIKRLTACNGAVTFDYREVPGKWHLELLTYYQYQSGVFPEKPIFREHFTLHTDGIVSIYPLYRWDGATGAPDTDRVIRASLEHDPLSQLYREGVLNEEDVVTFNNRFEDTCDEDGMAPLVFKFYRACLKLWWRVTR